MKIKDRSRKQSHKLDGIGIGRIRTFPFSSDSAYDSVVYDPVKTRVSDLSDSEAEGKKQPITILAIEHCDWFILPLLRPTPTMQFSLDRKRRSHKRNWYFASDSDSVIFTRSYRSALLITTSNPSPSLVKTSLEGFVFEITTQYDTELTTDFE